MLKGSGTAAPRHNSRASRARAPPGVLHHHVRLGHATHRHGRDLTHWRPPVPSTASTAALAAASAPAAGRDPSAPAALRRASTGRPSAGLTSGWVLPASSLTDFQAVSAGGSKWLALAVEPAKVRLAPAACGVPVPEAGRRGRAWRLRTTSAA
jgi:hypothetical protein